MAPKRERSPPAIQARNTSAEEPTSCIISRGTRKMPLPMMVPTTMAVAWLAPSTRGRSAGAWGGGAEGDWLMRGCEGSTRASAGFTYPAQSQDSYSLTSLFQADSHDGIRDGYVKVIASGVDNDADWISQLGWEFAGKVPVRSRTTYYGCCNSGLGRTSTLCTVMHIKTRRQNRCFTLKLCCLSSR